MLGVLVVGRNRVVYFKFYMQDWCQWLAHLPSKQRGPVRVRYLAPMNGETGSHGSLPKRGSIPLW